MKRQEIAVTSDLEAELLNRITFDKEFAKKIHKGAEIAENWK